MKIADINICTQIYVLDCQKFEIFQLDDHVGSCDVIYSEAGGFTLHYCIEKCLDLPGCRGTTFNLTTGRCDYHNCTNRTAAPGLTFMWKRCIDTGTFSKGLGFIFTIWPR
jgi:hypothetical protein